jgi:dihydropteroate synthase
MPQRASAQSLEKLLIELADGGRPPALMGVLNVTPDSFSDGGRFLEPGDASEQASRMIAEGAEIIDVGAESTRPGAEGVTPAEQIHRAVPVIEAIRQRHAGVPISVDTQSVEVANAALGAGADMVNDVSALRADPCMADLLAEHRVPVVLMHMRGEPRTMQTAGGGPVYADVVREVIEFLKERVEWAGERGIDRDRIIADPGIGFGKTVDHNLQLLRRLGEFESLRVPVLVGASRKTFIGEVTSVEVPDQRLAGSLVSIAAAVFGGADIIRVHDVAESRRAVRMAHAIRRA